MLAVRIGFAFGDEPAHPVIQQIGAVGDDCGQLEHRLDDRFRFGLRLLRRLGLGFRLGRSGNLLDCLAKGVAQLACIAGIEIAPAGLLGETGKVGLLACLDVEADHMDREVDASGFQVGCSRARIGIAGLEPVGDQNDRCRGIGMAQLFRGLADSCRDWRLAARLDGGDDLGVARRINGADRNNRLDVTAVAFLAVAIGHDTHVNAVGRRAEDIGDHFAGDDDLVLAVYLTPHGIGGIEDQHHILLILGNCTVLRQGKPG